MFGLHSVINKEATQLNCRTGTRTSARAAEANYHTPSLAPGPATPRRSLALAGRRQRPPDPGQALALPWPVLDAPGTSHQLARSILAQPLLSSLGKGPQLRASTPGFANTLPAQAAATLAPCRAVSGPYTELYSDFALASRSAVSPACSTTRTAAHAAGDRPGILVQKQGVQLDMTFLVDGTTVRTHQKAASAARKAALQHSEITVKHLAGLVAALEPALA